MDLGGEKAAAANTKHTQNVLKSSFRQHYPEISENKIALSISSERYFSEKGRKEDAKDGFCVELRYEEICSQEGSF